MKKDKSAKRKAKLKERKAQVIRDQQAQSNRIANALMELCAPVLPEYIDDSSGLDLVGRRIVWQMGQIAWNIAVTGRKEIGESAISKMNLTTEEQQIVKQEIDTLVRKKYEMYPAIRTAVSGILFFALFLKRNFFKKRV